MHTYIYIYIYIYMYMYMYIDIDIYRYIYIYNVARWLETRDWRVSNFDPVVHPIVDGELRSGDAQRHRHLQQTRSGESETERERERERGSGNVVLMASDGQQQPWLSSCPQN